MVTGYAGLTGLVVLIAVAAMSGCAPVSKSECQTGDWYDIGVRDGARGYGEERFLGNAQACAKHGLTADRERWLDGRMQGLQRYCTPHNAFEVGARNESYGGVCRQFDEGGFMRAYSLGRDLAEARATRSRWDGEISGIRDKLDRDDRRRKDDKSDDGDKTKDEERLTSAERTELGIRLGIALVKRADAQRRCEELEERGREFSAP
ncbi:MAG: DUF2799 domain-containing protein [Steroidobacteraceae bacterium]